jgi:VCBS repeat protein
MRAKTCPISLGVLVLSSCCLLPRAYCQPTRTVIDANFPGAYQVEVADVNGDKKPDIIAVGGSTCAWYENPTWKKRVVTGGKQTPGIISSATADLDGDGRAEIAIAYEFAMNKPTTGTLLLAVQARDLDDPWKLVPIGDIGSIHRLRWGDVDGDKRLDLVVAPIFGPEAKPPTYSDPPGVGVFRAFDWRGGPPRFQVITSRPIVHAIDVFDLFRDGRSWILTADDLGTSLIGLRKPPDAEKDEHWRREFVLTTAERSAPPTKRGASEAHLGRMKDGGRLLATIEPWHGNRVCAYWVSIRPSSGHDADLGQVGPRTVLDETLADGHALWVADVDGDGDDEVLAGHRGKDHRVSLYDYDRAGKTWTRTVLDRDIAAQDLRGGDLDGDGTPDVVAVGGATHNVVWYRFRRP